MKIQEIEIYAIRLPLKEPFDISYATYDDMPSIIVKLTTDTGESWEGTFSVLQHTLAPAVLGLNPAEFERLHECMDKKIYGVPTAKAAIDIACFDAVGKQLGVPAYQLLGGRYHEVFLITHVLSIGEPQAMADEAAERMEAGYNSFKMKVGTSGCSRR